MSINVFLFDDDTTAIEKMRNRLTKYSDITIFEFTSFEEFEKINDSMLKPDIAFIDIQFGNKTGFDVVSCIGQLNPNCLFVFVTNYSEYLKQGYEYRIYRYILKEEPEELIEKQISDTFDEYYKNNRFLIIHKDEGDVAVKLEDVKYIAVFDHTSVFYIRDGRTYRSSLSLSKLLENNLDKMFVRCHKGYIVNLNYIKGFENRNRIVIDNSVMIEIGRAYKAELFKKYNLFIQGKL